MSQTRSRGERLTLVWSKVTGWPAARPRYLPLWSVFLLDILSMMNCHFFSFRIKQRKWATARTRPPSPWRPIGTFQLSCIVCTLQTAAATGAPPLEFFLSLFLCRVYTCLCPSFPDLWTHTHAHTHAHIFTCDRQPLLLGPDTTPTSSCAPKALSSAPSDICALWSNCAGKAGGTSESTAGTEQGGPHSRVI